MGDLLFVNCHPTFFEESDLGQWTTMLKKVEHMEIDVAVPEHGSVGTKEDISKVIHYISDLTAIARGSHSIEEIKIPAKYSDWSSSDVFFAKYKNSRGFIKQGNSFIVKFPCFNHKKALFY